MDSSVVFKLKDKSNKDYYPWYSESTPYTDKNLKFIFDNIYKKTNTTNIQDINRLFFKPTNVDLNKYDTLPIWTKNDDITTTGWSFVYQGDSINTFNSIDEFKNVITDKSKWELYFGNTPFNKYFAPYELSLGISNIKKDSDKYIFSVYLNYKKKYITSDTFTIFEDKINQFYNFKSRNISKHYLKIFKKRDEGDINKYYLNFNGNEIEWDQVKNNLKEIPLSIDKKEKIRITNSGFDKDYGQFKIEYIHDTLSTPYDYLIYSYDKNDVNSILDNLAFKYKGKIDFSLSEQDIKNYIKIHLLSYNKIYDFKDDANINLAITKDNLVIDKENKKIYIKINYKHSDNKTYFRMFDISYFEEKSDDDIKNELKNIVDSLNIDQAQFNKTMFPSEISKDNIKIENEISINKNYFDTKIELTPDNVIGNLTIKLIITSKLNPSIEEQKDSPFNGFLTYQQYVDKMNNNESIEILLTIDRNKLPSKITLEEIKEHIKVKIKENKNTKSHVVKDNQFTLSVDELKVIKQDNLMGEIIVSGLKLRLLHDGTYVDSTELIKINPDKTITFNGFSTYENELKKVNFVYDVNKIRDLFPSEVTNENIGLDISNYENLDKDNFKDIKWNIKNQNNVEGNIEVSVELNYEYEIGNKIPVTIPVKTINGFLTYQQYVNKMNNDEFIEISLTPDNKKLPSKISLDYIKTHIKFKIKENKNTKSHVVKDDQFTLLVDDIKIINPDNINGEITISKLRLKLSYDKTSPYFFVYSTNYISDKSVPGFSTYKKQLDNVKVNIYADKAKEYFPKEITKNHEIFILENFGDLEEGKIIKDIVVDSFDNIKGTINVTINLKYNHNNIARDHISSKQDKIQFPGFLTYQQYVDEMVKNSNIEIKLDRADIDKIPSKNDIATHKDLIELKVKNNPKSNIVSNDKFELIKDYITVYNDDLNGIITISGLKLKLKYDINGSVDSTISIPNEEFNNFSTYKKQLNKITFKVDKNKTKDLFPSEVTSENIGFEIVDYKDLDRNKLKKPELTIYDKKDEEGQLLIDVKLNYEYENGKPNVSVTLYKQPIKDLLTYEKYLHDLLENYKSDLLIETSENNSFWSDKLPKELKVEDLKINVKNHDNHKEINNKIHISSDHIEFNKDNMNGILKITKLGINYDNNWNFKSNQKDISNDAIIFDFFDSWQKQFKRFEVNVMFEDKDEIYGKITIDNKEKINVLPKAFIFDNHHKYSYINGNKTDKPPYIDCKSGIISKDDEQGVVEIELSYWHTADTTNLSKSKTVLFENFITINDVKKQLQNLKSDDFVKLNAVKPDDKSSQIPSTFCREEFTRIYKFSPEKEKELKRAFIPSSKCIYANDIDGIIRYNVQVNRFGIEETIVIEKREKKWEDHLKDEFKNYVNRNIKGTFKVEVDNNVIKQEYVGTGNELDIYKPGVLPSDLNKNINNNDYFKYRINKFGYFKNINDLNKNNNDKEQVMIRIDEQNNVSKEEKRFIWMDLILEQTLHEYDDVTGDVLVSFVLKNDDIKFNERIDKKTYQLWSIKKDLEYTRNKAKNISSLSWSKIEDVKEALDVFEKNVNRIKDNELYNEKHKDIYKEYKDELENLKEKWYTKEDDRINKEIDKLKSITEVNIKNASILENLTDKFNEDKTNIENEISKLKLEKNKQDGNKILKDLESKYNKKLKEMTDILNESLSTNLNFVSLSLLIIGLLGIIGSGSWLYLIFNKIRKNKKDYNV
ncbi:lipoprotein 17-related variable surface protein [Mycoplasma elephantis]|uniref:lipoprotein 17-related variable surface protein n=1 Tax=Mycoplasma elephantis TaxID=114882 RepID=UPI000489549B|nr:lipoprotein 17-related variable surface protein [Mycoplasma elephantis]